MDPRRTQPRPPAPRRPAPGSPGTRAPAQDAAASAPIAGTPAAANARTSSATRPVGWESVPASNVTPASAAAATSPPMRLAHRARTSLFTRDCRAAAASSSSEPHDHGQSRGQRDAAAPTICVQQGRVHDTCRVPASRPRPPPPPLDPVGRLGMHGDPATGPRARRATTLVRTSADRTGSPAVAQSPIIFAQPVRAACAAATAGDRPDPVRRPQPSRNWSMLDNPRTGVHGPGQFLVPAEPLGRVTGQPGARIMRDARRRGAPAARPGARPGRTDDRAAQRTGWVCDIDQTGQQPSLRDQPRTRYPIDPSTGRRRRTDPPARRREARTPGPGPRSSREPRPTPAYRAAPCPRWAEPLSDNHHEPSGSYRCGLLGHPPRTSSTTARGRTI